MNLRNVQVFPHLSKTIKNKMDKRYLFIYKHVGFIHFILMFVPLSTHTYIHTYTVHAYEMLLWLLLLFLFQFLFLLLVAKFVYVFVAKIKFHLNATHTYILCNILTCGKLSVGFIYDEKGLKKTFSLCE